jgi:hypothetical protein
MKINKHYSIIHSEKVLTLVKRMVRKIKTKHDVVNRQLESGITIEHFSNCREQGYSLIIYKNATSTLRINFAQQRNSDQIVVVFGPSEGFNISTNAPNEEIYAGNQCFGIDMDAVKYIVRLITDFSVS